MDKIDKMESVALHYDYEGRGWCPIVGESGSVPRTEMKGKRLLGSDSTVLQACVLGLPLQGWKIDSESFVSRGY